MWPAAACLLLLLLPSTGTLVALPPFIPSGWDGSAPHPPRPPVAPCTLPTPLNIGSSITSPVLPVLRVPSLACRYPDFSLLKYYIKNRKTTLYPHSDSQDISYQASICCKVLPPLTETPLSDSALSPSDPVYSPHPHLYFLLLLL